MRASREGSSTLAYATCGGAPHTAAKLCPVTQAPPPASPARKSRSRAAARAPAAAGATEMASMGPACTAAQIPVVVDGTGAKATFSKGAARRGLGAEAAARLKAEALPWLAPLWALLGTWDFASVG